MAHPLVKGVIIILSLSGILQGLAWTVLAALALCVHNGILELKAASDGTHMENLGAAIKVLYFSEENDKNVVSYVAMMAILISYICISSIWLLFSSFTFYLARMELLRLAKNALVVHCLLLTLITALDITFISMLAVDYQDLNSVAKPVRIVHTYLLFASGLMITLAARGYVLLLFNVICLVYAFIVILWNGQREDNEGKSITNCPPQRRTIIEAFNEDPVAARWQQPYTGRDFENEGFDYHENDPFDDGLEAETRYYRSESRAKPVEPPRPPTAKNQFTPSPKSVVKPPPMPPPKPMKPQGKKGPPIPFPDYPQPPPPPNLRPVIKPYSSYF